MHSILDADTWRCLFKIQVEMSSTQLGFGAEVGNCQCTCDLGKLGNHQGVNEHVDIEGALGQSLVHLQCLEVGEIGKNHKEN